MKEEIWKEVIGTEGCYEASSFGRIRSVSKFVRFHHPAGGIFWRWKEGRIMKTYIDKRTGRHRLYTSVNGKLRHYFRYQMVCKAFHSNPMGYTQVNHIDNNPVNDCPENLEWGNQSMNILHAVKTGRHKISRMIGESCGMSKLKDGQVAEIKRLLKGRKYWGRQVRIGKKYNVSPACIFGIEHGLTWTHIKI